MKYLELKKELGHKERTINDLVSYLRTRTSLSNPNYSLLLGAGASVTSGIRSGAQLVDTWRKEIYELYSSEEYIDSQTAKNYLMTKEGSWYSEQNEYSALFEKKFDLPSQRRRFVEQEVDQATPSIGYAYLVSLANECDRYLGTIYTTNFDDLINEAFYQFSLNRPLVCAHDSSVNSLSVSSTRPKIIKLHGDYLFDDIKSTLRETESLETNIKNKFIEFSKEYGLIVVGYAGHDRSIMDVLNHLLKSEDYFKNGIYWCIRDGDVISPEVRKLIWKERVYFVKIDGYDQLMAELHHKLIGELPVKDNLFESKHERILGSFATDRNELSKTSDFIRSDITKLKRHKSEIDISNSIRDLNLSEFEDEISESIFKSLLKIDSLIKNNEFEPALSIAEKYINELNGSRETALFIRKMIFMCSKTNRHTDAIKYCDMLIDIDEYNHEYYLMKADSYQKITETCTFLKEHLNRFPSNSEFLVGITRRALREYSSVRRPTFEIKEIFDIVESCLTLDPSLDNPSWSLMLSLIELKYKGKNDKNSYEKKKEEVDELINRAGAINPDHIRYLNLISESVILDSKESIDSALQRNQKVFDKSKRSKKKKIFSNICGVYSYLAECPLNDINSHEMLQNFFEGDLVKEASFKKDISSYYLIKAFYEINVNDDFKEFKDCVIKASKASDAYESAAAIVNMMLRQLDNPDLARSFLKENESELNEVVYFHLQSEVELFLGNFDLALDHLESSYSFGLTLENYITSKCFILVKSEKYKKVIDFVDENKDLNLSEEQKSILLVNKEFSKKQLNMGIKEVILRNIIGKKLGMGMNAACFSILGDLAAAQRAIDDNIKKDRLNYGLHKTWIVLDSSLLEKHDHTISGSQKKPNLAVA
ncbi:SIR2 family protein [Vibrio diabolicus]|uniref:SIR2 family protein n=2 Tax=Vibrionaceae TaxID=641 RepID=UPI0009B5F873|nr:SIR2 family protein [Vibrio diabolicus]MCS0388638.1 SIR2 family protein [Vibrio diabolicus]OQK33436.1 putative TPR domain protein [Vibrio parahaemolyticus]